MVVSSIVLFTALLCSQLRCHLILRLANGIRGEGDRGRVKRFVA
jgi:hypothetical protein